MAKFRRGFSHAKEEVKRMEKERASWGKKLYEFYLSADGDEADVVFLNEEPVECFVHNRVARRGGKEFFDTVVCTRDADCPDCENGEKATYKGAFLVIDTRPYEGKDASGKKKTVPYTLRFYLPGVRVVTALERISSKYGLLNREVNISRSGKGPQTSYHIERSDNIWDLDVEEMHELMRSDEVKKLYKGDPEDIYDIIYQQLDLLLSNSEGDAEKDEEEDSRGNIVKRGGAKKFGSSRSKTEDETEGEEEDDGGGIIAKTRKRLSVKKKVVDEEAFDEIDEDDDLPF